MLRYPKIFAALTLITIIGVLLYQTFLPTIVYGAGGDIVFNDTFTGTDDTLLDAHTPDTGTSWTKVYNVGGSSCSNIATLGITSNELQNICADATTAGAAYLSDATYPSADYQVSYTCADCGANDEHITGIIRSTAAFDEADGAYVFYNASAVTTDNPVLAMVASGSTCTALKTVDVGLTALGFAFGPDGTTFVMQAAANEISVFRNNVAYHVVTNATNTAAGKGGIGMGGSPCNPSGDLVDGETQADAFSITQIATASTTYNAPSTTGEITNDWTNPTNAYSDDASYAEEDDVGEDQDYGDFGFSIPAGSTIRGIQVKAEAKGGTLGSTVDMGVEVSNDNGATWSSQLTGRWDPENTLLFGHANYLWGLTWTVTDTADTDFRIRLAHTASESLSAGRDLEVDYVAVKIFYDEGAGGGGGAAAGTPAKVNIIQAQMILRNGELKIL